jgi:hypothetical protein
MKADVAGFASEIGNVAPSSEHLLLSMALSDALTPDEPQASTANNISSSPDFSLHQITSTIEERLEEVLKQYCRVCRSRDSLLIERARFFGEAATDAN